MISLKSTDGTEPHLRAAQEHSWRCRQKNTEPIFKTLQFEGETIYLRLKTKSREAEDSFDEASNLRNDMDGAELRFEKETRNTYSTISSLDRDQPQLGVLLKIFPKGLDDVIKHERGKQIIPGQQLLDRMEPFLAYPQVQQSFDKTKIALEDLGKALEEWEKALRNYQKVFSQERDLRTAVREQIIDAKARLTQFFKSAPEQADKYFLSDPHASSTTLYRAELQGRIGAKIEVLLSFINLKKIEYTKDEKEIIEATNEEKIIDVWMSRAFAGVANIHEILAEIPE